jgi:hypothetical protein
LTSVLRTCLRIVLTAASLAYLAFMLISHFRPFSPTLEAPLALGGWLLLLIPIVQAAVQFCGYDRDELRSTRKLAWAALRGRRGLAVYGALMVAIFVAAGVAGTVGDLSTSCNNSDPAATCLKIDKWTAADGKYYRQYPYDAQGNSDPNAAWVPISRDEYVAEVGTRLRAAAMFGVLSLGLAFLATLVEEATAAGLKARPFQEGYV